MPPSSPWVTPNPISSRSCTPSWPWPAGSIPFPAHRRRRGSSSSPPLPPLAATSLALRLAALNPLRNPRAGTAAAAVAADAAALELHLGYTDFGSFSFTCNILVAADRSAVVLPAVDTRIESARRGGRLNDLGMATTMRAQVRYTLGRLRDAEEDARLADRLAAGYDREARRHPKAWLLCCLVERGALDEAESELGDSDVPFTLAHLLVARARLRLAQDRPADALDDLEECGRRLRQRGVRHPNFAPWQAWSAVALTRLGRADEGRAAATDAVAAAREFGSARAEGVALWASGIIERSADILGDAVAVLRSVPAPVELARALIDLGAALRRANHRSDARGRLEEGMHLAHHCGADALVATARLELATAGVHVRPRVVIGPDVLTPTERRVADLAAGGATNRDIAQTLFVSPKTVENHLGHAYRKLGVASRRELADVLATTS